MSGDAETAQGCFADNLRLFGSGSKADAEQANLYRGLMLLAKAVGDLDARLDELEADLYQVRHEQFYQVVH